MAARLGMSRNTFQKYLPGFFADAIERGRARTEEEVARALVDKAKTGDNTAIIWLQKTFFGASERSIVLPSGQSTESIPSGALLGVPIGLFLPINGREVPAEGEEIPASFRVIAQNESASAAPTHSSVRLPTNGREFP